jgi:hypothetical protein
MAGETKKTAVKKTAKSGPRKPNTTADKKKKAAKPAGKGTKSASNKEKKAGLGTGAKKLKRNVNSKKLSPRKDS